MGRNMKNGYDDPKVTPISAARQKWGKARRSGRGRPGRTPRDWLIGGIFTAMALGLVAYGAMAAYQWLSALAR
jgi:hypothetical protein